LQFDSLRWTMRGGILSGPKTKMPPMTSFTFLPY
jgi:hypothetical protein